MWAVWQSGRSEERVIVARSGCGRLIECIDNKLNDRYMKALGKLAGQTAVYGISSVVARLLNYLLVPYYTRIMPQAEYGVITDIYALIPFLLIVLTMGMESGYFRFAARATDEGEKRKVFATTWGAVSLAALLFFVAVMMFRPQLAEVMGYGDTPSYVWVVGLIVVFDVVNAIPFARLREQGRAMRYVTVRLLSVIINLGLCVWFYNWLPESWAFYSSPVDAGYAFAANLIASGVTFLLLLPSCDGVVPRIDRRLFRRILLYSLPLLISGIAGTANEYIDRQMIKYLMPAGEAMAALGVYGAVVKIGVVMLMFTQMYRMAAEPFFLAEFKKEEFGEANAEALKYFVLVSVFIFLVIGLFADVFALIVGRDFREGIHILPVVLVSNMLSGVVLNLSFWYKQVGATRYAIYVTGVGLVFTLVFNVMLVPRLGYFGAALARLICEAAMVAVSYWLNRRHYPIDYDLRRMGEYLLIGALLYGAGMACVDCEAWMRYGVSAVLVTAFVVYAVRRERIDVRGLMKAIIRKR